MGLTLSIDRAKGNLALPSLYEEAVRALRLLRDGTGRGNDYIGWLDLPVNADREELARIKASAEKIKADSKALVVIGIGGSYLGARAALEFIKSPNYNALATQTPELYFAGNNLSADALNEIIRMIGERDFSVNVISKSGTTTEPAIAFRIFKELLERKYGAAEAAKRIYVTTDRAHGVLKGMADECGYETFVIPDDVGGRYSVLTPVGLLPLAAAGVDLDKLLSGTAAAMEDGKSEDPEVNPCLKYAAVRNGLYREGKTIEIFVGFEPRLRYTGEWWKQLYGESEGKEGKGLFPASTDMTADLHSMGQYIQEGLRCLMETFVKIENADAPYIIPKTEKDEDKLNFVADKELTYVNHQALLATMEAHETGGVPGMLVTIDRADAWHFGYLCYFFELACGISGYMLGVNPFDQPGVEAYKNNMFRLLGKPGYEK